MSPGCLLLSDCLLMLSTPRLQSLSLPSARLQTFFLSQTEAFLGILSNAAAILHRVICALSARVRAPLCASHILAVFFYFIFFHPLVCERAGSAVNVSGSCGLSGEAEEQTRAGFSLSWEIMTAVAKADTLDPSGRLGSKQHFFFPSLKYAFHVLNCLFLPVAERQRVLFLIFNGSLCCILSPRLTVSQHPIFGF